MVRILPAADSEWLLKVAVKENLLEIDAIKFVLGYKIRQRFYKRGAILCRRDSCREVEGACPSANRNGR